MNRRILTTLLITLVLGMNACKKDEVVPVSPIPEIEFISISPNPVVEYSQEVIITISYKDGDGDLGENNAEIDNVFVTDSRNQLEYKFRVKQLAPDNSEIHIQGDLDIVLNNVSVISGTSTQEKVTYDVHVVDRAGNVSNTITTSELTVTR